MLYLLWALINIALFLSFLVVCFKATTLIRTKLGWGAALLFVFGLLSFVVNTGADEDIPESDSKIKTWEFVADDSVANQANTYIVADLENTWISTYNLGIQYAKGQEVNTPVSAGTWTTGIKSGTAWKAASVLVKRTTDNHKFQYEVRGTIDWRLLGFTIYSQSKTYKGELAIQ